MNDDTVQLFLNPTAGRGRAGKRLARILELLHEAGLDVTTHGSSAVGDLERRVRECAASGCKKLVVAGGDGSIHEAANGILAAGADTALGVIPSGTGNDFAKAAGITLDWEAATRLLADRIVSNASPRRIDAGRMNDRYFANGAGVGFDARVTSIARAYRWPIGDLVYLVAIFRAMTEGLVSPGVRVQCEELPWDGPLTLANVSNGPWIGGMFHIAPMAKHADGKLELLVVRPVTRRRITALLPKLMKGTHMTEPEISHASVQKLVIESDTALPAHLDGEVMPPDSRFEIEVLPDALSLL